MIYVGLNFLILSIKSIKTNNRSTNEISLIYSFKKYKHKDLWDFEHTLFF